MKKFTIMLVAVCALSVTAFGRKKNPPPDPALCTINYMYITDDALRASFPPVTESRVGPSMAKRLRKERPIQTLSQPMVNELVSPGIGSNPLADGQVLVRDGPPESGKWRWVLTPERQKRLDDETAKAFAAGYGVLELTSAGEGRDFSQTTSYGYHAEGFSGHNDYYQVVLKDAHGAVVWKRTIDVQSGIFSHADVVGDQSTAGAYEYVGGSRDALTGAFGEIQDERRRCK